jgi:hypothetical protein
MMPSGVLFLRLFNCSKTLIEVAGQLVQMQLANWLSIVSDGAYYTV